MKNIVFLLISICSLGTISSKDTIPDCLTLLSVLENQYSSYWNGRTDHEEYETLFNSYMSTADLLNCPAEKGKALVMLGVIHRKNGDYQNAEFYFREGMKIRKTLNDLFGIASVYNNLITSAQQQELNGLGISYSDTALQFLSVIPIQEQKVLDLKHKIIFNKGHCYRGLGEFFEARKMYKEVEDSTSNIYPLVLQSLGDVAYDLREFSMSLNNYEKAFSLYNRNSNLFAIAQLSRSIGYAYLGLKDTSYAILSFLKSARLAKEIDNKILQADAFVSLSNYLPKYSNPESIGININELLQTLNQDIGNLEERKEMVEILSDHFERKNDYKTVSELQKKAAAFLNDSLVSKIKLNEKLETERELGKTIQHRERLITGLIIGLLVVLICSLIIFLKREREKRQFERRLREKVSFETHDIKSGIAAMRNNLHFIVDKITNLRDAKAKGLLTDNYLLAERLVEQVDRVNKMLDPDTGQWYQDLLTRLRLLEDGSNMIVRINRQGLNQQIDPVLGHTILGILNVLIENVEEHSEAGNVLLNLKKVPDKLYISFWDDGKGFSPEQEGVGLKSVRKRVDNLGGTVNIDSQSGAGTKIDIKVPI